jgi:hypothetical protein
MQLQLTDVHLPLHHPFTITHGENGLGVKLLQPRDNS